MLSRRLTSGLGMAGLMVPVVLAVSMVVPEHGGWPLGVSEVLACSGGGSGVGGGNIAPPQPSWGLLKPAQADQPGIGPATAIATDGFLPLQGSYVGLSVEQALASIQVVVTDEAGKEIPGIVRAFGAPDQYVFGWTATDALTIGQHVTASLSVPAALDAGVGGKFPLEVVGAPETLPEPSLLFQGWIDNYDGVGPLVSCHGDLGSCGSAEIQVYGAYEASGHSVTLYSQVAPKSGVVWEVSIAQSASHPESTSSPFPPTVITGAEGGERPIGAVELGLTAEQACALVIVKDLRTGAETRGDVCHAAEAATGINTGGGALSLCSEPPTPAVRDLWCEARGNYGPACDVRATDPANPPTSNPVGSDPFVGADPGATDPTTANVSSPDHGASTSKGCQLGQAGSAPSSTAWALCLAALSVAIVRRRR